MTSTPTVGTAPSRISVARQAGALGAIVTGVDLAQPVDDGTFTAIHDAFLENLVICIRGQEHLSPDDQLTFAARWGEISIHPYVPSIDGYPGIMRIHDANPVTTTWHADTTHAAEPPALTCSSPARCRRTAATRCSPTSTSRTRTSHRVCAPPSTACAPSIVAPSSPPKQGSTATP